MSDPMVETRERPLSLSYRRPADRSERAVLERAMDGLHHDPQADLAEIGSGLGLGFISLLFIGPVALLLAWLLQFGTGVTFGTDQTWLMAALVWLAAWGGLSAWRVVARSLRIRFRMSTSEGAAVSLVRGRPLPRKRVDSAVVATDNGNNSSFSRCLQG